MTQLAQLDLLRRDVDGRPSAPMRDFFSVTFGVDISSLLVRLEIAELAMQRRWPKADSVPKGLLAQLCPSTPLLGKTDTLYRHHVDELLERAATRTDMRPGTDAEVLAALLDAALKAPLNRDASLLAHLLFARVFPGRIPEADTAHWPMHLTETHQRYRHLTRARWRVVVCI